MRHPNVELSSLRIRGYRSCKNTALSFDPKITALIGKNGGGKTNVLHGIRLLRGPNRRRFRRVEKDFLAISCSLEAQFRVYGKSIGLRSRVTLRPNESGNLEEIEQSREKWDLRAFGISRPWISVTLEGSLRTIQRKGQLLFQEISGPMIEVGKKEGQTKFERPNKTVASAIQNIMNFRSRFTYYSASQFTNPALCPTSFEVDEDGDLRESISSTSSSHVSFLYDLYSLSQRDDALYTNYTTLVGAMGVCLVDKFVWKKANVSTRTAEVRSGGRLVKKKRERILIIPTVHIGEDQLSFNQLSEGTFRTLAMLFYIVTDQRKFLLLEEPELCVHHGLLTNVLDVLKQFSQTKQIVMSTHSEFVLDNLAPEQVRLISREPKRGTLAKSISRTMSARDFAALRAYLEKSGSLGEYWRHSGFEQ